MDSSNNSAGNTGRSSRAKAPKDYQSFLDSLKVEWKLFWAGIIGDEPEKIDLNDHTPLQVLNLEQTKTLIRTLSNDRRKIHRRLESINKEIEDNTQRLQTIELVGGEKDETLKAIEKLSDLGIQMSHELEKLNERLKEARRTQDQMIKQLVNNSADAN
jgi:hypothetical protein